MMKVKRGLAGGPSSSQPGVLVEREDSDSQRPRDVSALGGKTRREQGKEEAICKPRREAPGEAKTADTPILHFQPSEL